MYIAVYAGLGALMTGFMLIFFITSDRRWRYINTVFSVMLFFLLLFEILSGLFGIHQVGAFGSSNMPEDWITQGWFGWLLLVLLTIGLFAPVWIPALSRSSADSSAE